MITYQIGCVRYLPKTWKFPAGEVGIAIFKDPKTDSKKKSAKGLLFVDSKDIEGKEELFLVDNVAKEAESCVSNMLQTIFIDGRL